MECEIIVLARFGGRWAHKHKGGVIGHTDTQDEARQIASRLAAWLNEQGRCVEVQVESEAA